MFLIGYEVEFVSGYIDGSFQTDRDDNKQQSDFVFYFNGLGVSQESSMLEMVADYSREDEYIATLEVEGGCLDHSVCF